ncbi:MAG: sugar dehydrogenase [Solirubrobacterales bacterium]|nr:sugar dehydrogenase [Solirubrobacterales bacterium]
MRRARTTAACLAFAGAVLLVAGGRWDPSAVAAGNGKGGATLKSIGRFRSPVYVDSAPGSRGLFVVEQAGRVRLVLRGRRLGRPFLDIRRLVRFGGEQGLLSIAFPPDYGSSGRFYAYFVNNEGSIEIDEFRRSAGNPNRAKRKTRRVVITIPHPDESNHNGGQLQFGPGGYLFAGAGDGGGAGDADNSAQRTDNLLGKLIRIDPRESGGRPYTVPASNPFVGDPGRDEIYSIGLRNPFRFSFDLTTKPSRPRIAIGDVGQDAFEEVDYETVAAARGANFGWNDFEGFSHYDGAIPPAPSRHDQPVLAYPHSRGCTVIGGYVVADRSLKSLRGRYLYGDYCTGKLRSFVPALGRAKHDRGTGLRVGSLSSFGEGRGGALYATSLSGPVFRVVPGKR